MVLKDGERLWRLAGEVGGSEGGGQARPGQARGQLRPRREHVDLSHQWERENIQTGRLIQFG